MIEWISVKETRDWTNAGFLLVHMSGGIRRYLFARWDTGEGWKDRNGRSLHYDDVTHFMKIQEPEGITNE